MKNFRNIIIISLLVGFILSSCETDITVDLPTPEEKLIVEGRIETNEKAFVFLTKNTGYFEPVNIPELDSGTDLSELVSFLEESIGLVYDSSIVMTVNSNGVTDTLIPGFDFTTFPYFGYQSQTMVGENGNSYRLEIERGDKSYWSETTIPYPVEIDSIWMDVIEDRDTMATLGAFVVDPINERNFYIVESQIVGEQLTHLSSYFGLSMYDDEILNGDTIRFTPIFKGYDGNAFFEDNTETDEDFANRLYFDVGSTVSIKLSSIDIASFIFWNSYIKHLGTAGNPFTNPATLKSNIEGDNSDGVWAGYGTDIKQVTLNGDLIPISE